ncbi:hypothetical protein METHPM2_530014 [Pseudomonas sp. PM2]
MVIMPTTAAREEEAAADAQHDQKGNQQHESSKHLTILKGSYRVSQAPDKTFHRL